MTLQDGIRPATSLAFTPPISRAPQDSSSVFDLDNLDAAVKTSPGHLKDWLDIHLPWLVGPHISAFEPAAGQRASIMTIRGSNFAPARADNTVTIGAITVPVLMASDTELKVLVTSDVDTGPVEVTVGTHTAIGAGTFTVTGYPGDPDEDGPPVFTVGEGR